MTRGGLRIVIMILLVKGMPHTKGHKFTYNFIEHSSNELCSKTILPYLIQLHRNDLFL